MAVSKGHVKITQAMLDAEAFIRRIAAAWTAPLTSLQKLASPPGLGPAVAAAQATTTPALDPWPTPQLPQPTDSQAPPTSTVSIEQVAQMVETAQMVQVAQAQAQAAQNAATFQGAQTTQSLATTAAVAASSYAAPTIPEAPEAPKTAAQGVTGAMASAETCISCDLFIRDRMVFHMLFNPHPGLSDEDWGHFLQQVRLQYQIWDRHALQRRRPNMAHCSHCVDPQGYTRTSFDRFELLKNNKRLRVNVNDRWYKKVKTVDEAFRLLAHRAFSLDFTDSKALAELQGLIKALTTERGNLVAVHDSLFRVTMPSLLTHDVTYAMDQLHDLSSSQAKVNRECVIRILHQWDRKTPFPSDIKPLVPKFADESKSSAANGLHLIADAVLAVATATEVRE